MMFKNMSLGRKLALGFGLQMGLLLVVLAVAKLGAHTLEKQTVRLLQNRELAYDLMAREVEQLDWIRGVADAVNATVVISTVAIIVVNLALTAVYQVFFPLQIG